MGFSPVAHEPSVADCRDTSPIELGRRMGERPYGNGLPRRRIDGRDGGLPVQRRKAKVLWWEGVPKS